jgi:hypothetical protein
MECIVAFGNRYSTLLASLLAGVLVAGFLIFRIHSLALQEAKSGKRSRLV